MKIEEKDGQKTVKKNGKEFRIVERNGVPFIAPNVKKGKKNGKDELILEMPELRIKRK